MTTFTKISKDADGFSSNTYRVQLAKRQARRLGNVYESILVDRVDLWYDVHLRYWVIQFKSADGYQIGDAEYSYGGGLKAAKEEVVRLIAAELVL